MAFNIFIIILIFCAVNIAVLFFIQTRTSRIIAIISTHLLIILCFNIYLKNFLNFKELVLGIIIYSMMILFLISNNKFFLYYLQKEHISLGKKINTKSFFKFYLPAIICAIGASIAILIIVINAPQIREIVRDKKLNPHMQSTSSLIMPSHPVHLLVQEFYFAKKSPLKNRDEKLALKIEKNAYYTSKIRESLKDNVMIKRISDIIIIVIAFFCGLLIFSDKKLNHLSRENL